MFRKRNSQKNKFTKSQVLWEFLGLTPGKETRMGLYVIALDFGIENIKSIAEK